MHDVEMQEIVFRTQREIAVLYAAYVSEPTPERLKAYCVKLEDVARHLAELEFVREMSKQPLDRHRWKD